MLFNSLGFLLFFAIVITLFYQLPTKYRYLMLLVASYYFYFSSSPEYVLLLLFSTVVDYVSALAIVNTQNNIRKKVYLTASICTNLSLLFFYKYYNFASENLNWLLENFAIGLQAPTLNIILPVGISFFTFQSLSYVIDVYRGVMPAQKNFALLALYESYFPQLVAGPIESAKHLLPQFEFKTKFNPDNFIMGGKLVLWGFFKKLVIADRAAFVVDNVYSDPTTHPTFALIATLLFAIQIYCDFSGYSDIAKGISKMMGVDLLTNFNRPYFARTITDFWKRWHISLTNWFKNYVFIPLGGSRNGLRITLRNIFVVFLLSGLWHGAEWTYIIWGIWHACFMILEALIRHFIKIQLPDIFSMFTRIYTLFVVSIGWVFFRSDELPEAILTLQNISKFPYLALDTFKITSGIQGIINVLSFSLLILFIVELFQENENLYSKYQNSPLIFRYASYFCLACLTLLFLVDGDQSFIYFQF